VTIIRADAFHLPFGDQTFDIIVADPPYDLPHSKTGRTKAGVSTRSYIGFKGREWFWEAWRVLKDTGRLYVFAATRELRAWLNGGFPEEEDILAWPAPNVVSINARYGKAHRMRVRAWRPIIEWRKPDAPSLELVNGLARPNFIVKSLIAYPMRERQEWPNQLPLAVVRWLIEPVVGDTVLDLFSGTGTTRLVAEGLGRRGVSVEMVEDAIHLNAARDHLPLDSALSQMTGSTT